MASLPTLRAKQDNISMVDAFLGINNGLHIMDNEFSDMENMTNDYYPVLSTRKRRGMVGTLTKPQGMLGGEKLVYVDNNKLYRGFKKIYDLSETNKERQLVMIGAYLCVFPDGIVYNTQDDTVETMENKTRASTGVTMRMCKLDGTEFTSSNTHIGTEAPTDTTTYPYWLDTSKENDVVLKMWSETYSMWTSVATTYVKISATDFGKGFKAYDSVKLNGIRVKGYNDFDFNQNMIVYAAGDDYIIVAGLMQLYYTQDYVVTAERTVPEMDYVCELDNRIWGCSSKNHEIYACKQGDPKNWNFYAGLDNDSYAATIGTQGDFTGITSYGGYVFFFKEDGFHKLYGTKPSNYELIWKPCRGVQDGCSRSIAIVNEVLMYKSRDAICAYDGSVDTVSEKLGVEPYYEACAVGYRNKYYITMRDTEYKWRLYVYDMTKGTWVAEDDIRCLYMAYASNGTYIVKSNNELWVINNEKIYEKWFPSYTTLGTQYLYPFPSAGYQTYKPLYAGNIVSGELEPDMGWMVTTGDLGYESPFNKYLKRINIRMFLEASSKVKIEIEYDSSDVWEFVTEYYCNRRRSYEIPIAVRRADHVKIRLSGYGDVKIYSIAKAVEQGSGVNNGNI